MQRPRSITCQHLLRSSRHKDRPLGGRRWENGVFRSMPEVGMISCLCTCVPTSVLTGH